MSPIHDFERLPPDRAKSVLVEHYRNFSMESIIMRWICMEESFTKLYYGLMDFVKRRLLFVKKPKRFELKTICNVYGELVG